MNLKQINNLTELFFDQFNKQIDKDKISRPFISNQNLYLAKDNAIIKLN